MKIALCLHGLTGGNTGGNGVGIPLDLETPFNSFKKHLLDKNDIDIFMHSWSIDKKEELIQLYSPKQTLFEPQITFNDKHHKENIVKSRWYSAKKSIEIKTEYSQQNNIKYDMVISCRFDLIWFSDFNFNEYSPYNFYVSNWNHNGPNNVGPYLKENLNTDYGFLDFWFCSNDDYMNKFSLLYDNIDKLFLKVGPSNHRISYDFAKQLNLPISYTKYRGYDCEMYRRYKDPNWKLK